MILIGLPLGIFYEDIKNITIIMISITVLSWIIFRGCLPQQLEQKWRPEMQGQSFIQFYTKRYLDLEISRIFVRVVVIFYFIVSLIILL